MAKFFFLIMMISLVSCLHSRNSVSIAAEELEISFIEGFRRDQVAVHLNEFKIIDTVLESEKVSGFTGFNFDVQRFKKFVSIGHDNRTFNYPIKEAENLNFVVAVNEYKNSFVFDPTKGKYIGLNKDTSNKVIFWQQKHPFEYD
jgi:hypothetical protein